MHVAPGGGSGVREDPEVLRWDLAPDLTLFEWRRAVRDDAQRTAGEMMLPAVAQEHAAVHLHLQPVRAGRIADRDAFHADHAGARLRFPGAALRRAAQRP